MIEIGAICAKFKRFKVPEYDIELDIYGDDGEIPRAPWFLCETCADLYFSLRELGFECVAPDENIRELVREYAELRQQGASVFGQVAW